MDLNGFEFLSKPIAYRTHAGGTRDAYMDMFDYICYCAVRTSGAGGAMLLGNHGGKFSSISCYNYADSEEWPQSEDLYATIEFSWFDPHSKDIGHMQTLHCTLSDLRAELEKSMFSPRLKIFTCSLIGRICLTQSWNLSRCHSRSIGGRPPIDIVSVPAPLNSHTHVANVPQCNNLPSECCVLEKYVQYFYNNLYSGWRLTMQKYAKGVGFAVWGRQHST